MLDIILITTYKTFPAYISCEERFLIQLYETNQEKIKLKIIHSDYNVKNSLFKKFPLIYVNNNIINNHSLFIFFRDIIYNNIEFSEKESIHFSYLLSFFRNEFRQIYMKEYSCLKNNYEQTIRFPLNKIQSFYNHFLTTKEKDFIFLIMKYYIEEYTSIFPCEKIHFKFEDRDINMKILIVEINNEDTTNIINKYSIKTSLINKNSQNDALQEMEISNNWKNIFLSFGLFAGLSTILLLLSIIGKK